MYAVFLQASLGTDIAQILVTPSTNDQRTFYRITSPGARGRSARWEDVTAREELLLAPVRQRMLDIPPVVVRFTAADATQMAERGVPSTLGTKAIAAADKFFRVGATYNRSLGEVFFDENLPVLVASQDSILLSWSVLPTAPISMPPVVTTTAPVVHTVNEPQPQPTFRMASVPDVSISRAYVHREVYGQHDFEIFAKARARKENILLKGPTGSAKTMSALAFAASEGKPTFTISGSVNFEASEAIGQTMLDPVTGLPYFQYGGAIEVIRDGGVLILDEINFIPSKVITPFFPLLDDRREVVLKQNRGEIIKAHPDLLIVATMNPGYLGTQAMNFALANRFDHHLEWGYDEIVEKKLVDSKSLREFATQLRANPSIATPVPTNALMSILSNAKDFSLDYALANFLARFDEAERKAVDLILKGIRANIEADLGIAPTQAVEQEEIAPVVDWTIPVTVSQHATAAAANGHPAPTPF